MIKSEGRNPQTLQSLWTSLNKRSTSCGKTEICCSGEATTLQGNRHSRHRTRKQLCVHRRYRRNYRNLRLYPWKRPTYTHIYEGKWVQDTLPYGVIHRLASTEHSKGWPMPACNGATNKYQPTCRYPPGQSYPAIHTEEARIQILRHHPSGQWRRTAGIPKSRRIDKETTNLSFKELSADKSA